MSIHNDNDDDQSENSILTQKGWPPQQFTTYLILILKFSGSEYKWRFLLENQVERMDEDSQ